MKPIIGELVRAGTFEVRSCAEGELPEVGPGLHVSMTEAGLRAIEHLPMFRRVAIIPAEEFERIAAELEGLRAIIARNAMQRLDGTKFYVTPADIKASLDICYETQRTNPSALIPLNQRPQS